MTPTLRRHFPVLILLSVLLQAAPARAQIIFTIPPQAAANGEYPTGWHVMAGPSAWDFGYTRTEFDTAKSRTGFLVAGDFSKRVSKSVAVGGGGWYNGVSEYSVDGWSDINNPYAQSDITHVLGRNLFSVYGSVFYKNVGVQAGVVPVSVRHTVITKATGASVSDDDGGQVDTTVFGVVRLGPNDQELLKTSIAVGWGIQRFGARPEDAGIGDVPASPASIVFSGFGAFSVYLFKGLSADMSFWYTFGDEAGGVKDVGNRDQFRGTFGLGYHF
jgi:hypothetical protein